MLGLSPKGIIMKKSGMLICLLFVFCGSAFCNCPSSWQLKDNKCFKVVNSKKTWSNASADCKNQLRGAHLMYLNGRPFSFTDSLTNIQTKDYLVGAERKNDRWVWGNGIQVVKNFSKPPSKDEVYVVLKRKCSILSAKKSSFAAFYICESSNTSLNVKSTVTPSYGPTTATVETEKPTDILTNSFIQNITRLDFKQAVSLNTNSFIQNIKRLDFKQADSLNASINMMQQMLTSMETNEVEGEFDGRDIFLASKKLEEFSMLYAKYHVDKSEVLITRGNTAVFRAKKVFSASDDYNFQLADNPSQETVITLPKENFDSNGSLIVSMSFKELDILIARKQYNIRSSRFKLQSRILPTTIDPAPEVLKKNVTLNFSLSKVEPGVDRRKLCVFWKFPTPENNDTGWSSEGCTLVKSTDQYVECSCNHLTHFAVLMQVKDDQVPRDHDAVLTIITNIGLGLSIVGCIVTFLAYWRFTDVNSEQSQIRMNLVLVLAAAHTLFLLGSAAKSNIILCISVAALLQLFYTSALCWMFAEGIQLYMQIIKVFNTNLKMRQVYGFAWGLPLILIIVSLSIAGNGPGGLSSFVSEEFCWLSTKNNLIWTFIAPVLLLILFNHVILIMVVKEITKINNQNVTTEHTTVLRSSIRALVILAPLLGITWVVGLLCILGAGIAGLYIFTILNSFQGIFIFIFHCLRNSEIQGKLRRRVEAFDQSRLKQSSCDGHYHSNQTNPKQTNTVTCKQGKTLQTPQENIITLSDFDHADFQAS